MSTVFRKASDSANGGTKDWSIDVSDDGKSLVTRHGKTGSSQRTTVIPVQPGELDGERRRRIEAKLKSGYEPVSGSAPVASDTNQVYIRIQRQSDEAMSTLVKLGASADPETGLQVTLDEDDNVHVFIDRESHELNSATPTTWLVDRGTDEAMVAAILALGPEMADHFRITMSDNGGNIVDPSDLVNPSTGLKPPLLELAYAVGTRVKPIKMAPMMSTDGAQVHAVLL